MEKIEEKRKYLAISARLLACSAIREEDRLPIPFFASKSVPDNPCKLL